MRLKRGDDLVRPIPDDPVGAKSWGLRLLARVPRGAGSGCPDWVLASSDVAHSARPSVFDWPRRCHVHEVAFSTIQDVPVRDAVRCPARDDGELRDAPI